MGSTGTSCLTVQARVRQPLPEPAGSYTPRAATRWLGTNGAESIFDARQLGWQRGADVGRLWVQPDDGVCKAGGCSKDQL